MIAIGAAPYLIAFIYIIEGKKEKRGIRVLISPHALIVRPSHVEIIELGFINKHEVPGFQELSHLMGTKDFNFDQWQVNTFSLDSPG